LPSGKDMEANNKIMNCVTQKKLKLKKDKNRRESLSFCNSGKNTAQEPYKQRLSKLIKSDIDQSQQKIFSNKSVEEFSQNIERFSEINPLPVKFEMATDFLKKIYQRIFPKRQHFFQNKSVLLFSRNTKRIISKNPLRNKFERLKDFSKKIRFRFFPKYQKNFKNKSVNISDFINKRFFRKNSLLNFPELSTDFFQKIFRYVRRSFDFIDFETPIDRGFQRLGFAKCSKLVISFAFLSFFSSKINNVAKC